MEEKKIKPLTAPKKSDYRPRAHVNPFSDHEMFVKKSPELVDWSNYFSNNNHPKFIDVGCGYGKFLINLSKKTENNVLGLEIREKVCEFVNKKIEYLKSKNEVSNNVSCIKTNALFFLPNIFKEKSLEKIFILFPDPQFKKKKKKARIISEDLIFLYHFLLEKNGKIYFSTDVKEYFDYVMDIFNKNDFFEKIDDEVDFYKEITEGTDESDRAGKKTGAIFGAIFKKIDKN